MNRRCECGCRRPATTEWIHPNHEPWWLSDHCTIRHAPKLHALGWIDLTELDDRADEAPRVTRTGGPLDADCG